MKDTNEKLFELALCELQRINVKNIESVSFSNKDYNDGSKTLSIDIDYS